MKIKLAFHVGFVALIGLKFGEGRGCFELGDVIIINYLGGYLCTTFAIQASARGASSVQLLVSLDRLLNQSLQ